MLVGGSLEEIFSRMIREMSKLTRGFEKDFEAFDLSPFFKTRGSGFSIRIVQSGDREPKIDIKTFGDTDKESLRKRLEEKLGIRKGVKIPVKVEIKEKKEGPPKITEEPKTNVKRLDSRVIVDIDIPGVDSEESVDITELESSVEVKARTGDKMYFKILTKPPQYRLVRREFEKGKLHLEFAERL